MDPEKKGIKRILHGISTPGQGPTLVFFGGIHGNEPAGILALERVFKQLALRGTQTRGSLYAIAGNLTALKAGRRFIHTDLNRIWLPELLQQAGDKVPGERSPEEAEMLDLQKRIAGILNTCHPPFYFIDLHTTSSKTLPFITINDALINRKFAQSFPLPIILGLEEHLKGTLLSYINSQGYLAIGFESGQHQEEEAVTLAEAFIWNVLFTTGALSRAGIARAADYFKQLKTAAGGEKRFYEIAFRQLLRSADSFRMYPGFRSFQYISRGTELAELNTATIRAERDSILFMPLYQKQGEDGFFLIRRIPAFALAVSELLRQLRIGRLLRFLPGIGRPEGIGNTLVIHRLWARSAGRPLFHLLGYRYIPGVEGKVLLGNRDLLSRKKDYRKCPWYGGILRNFKAAGIKG